MNINYLTVVPKSNTGSEFNSGLSNRLLRQKLDRKEIKKLGEKLERNNQFVSAISNQLQFLPILIMMSLLSFHDKTPVSMICIYVVGFFITFQSSYCENYFEKYRTIVGMNNFLNIPGLFITIFTYMHFSCFLLHNYFTIFEFSVLFFPFSLFALFCSGLFNFLK